MRHIVILGNGISGITAARHIRRHSTDRITVISAETDHFYARTALMYLYMGQLEYHHTKPYEDWFWVKNRIELVRDYVETIDPEGRKLHFSAGSRPEISYDILILALGSRPNLPKFSGLARPGPSRPGLEGLSRIRGVQGLYGMPDLERMETDTRGIEQAVVVGGGLIGIELCEMLLSRKIRVTYLIREKGFWAGVLPDEESGLVTDHIREHGVDVRVGTQVESIKEDGSGRVTAIVTTEGQFIPCAFVGIAVGVSPNIDFLRNTRLETRTGILVDKYLRTNIPDVYAVGDCAEHRNPPPGRRAVEQIWYSGRIMGETVAQTVLGKPTAYQPGLFFNSAKFFDIEYQTYGSAPAQLPADGSLASFYWEHPGRRRTLRINYEVMTGAVIGVTALGLRQRQEVWERWIQERRSIQAVVDLLSEANFDPEFSRRYGREIQFHFKEQYPGGKSEQKGAKGCWSSLFPS